VNLACQNPFDLAAYLSASGSGRSIVHLEPNQSFFVQGAASSCLFYLQSGNARLIAVSAAGKEATIASVSPGDLIGEEIAAGAEPLHTTSAIAVSSCGALRIDGAEVARLLREEQAFSDRLMNFIVARGMRTQADLIDQLFNNSKKRLARALLLMADFGQPGPQHTLIPLVTQEALAEMIGTTRARVSFFMNRFRELGFIEYSCNRRIRVHQSLLNVILHDQVSNAPRTHALPPAASLPKAATLHYAA
jgi:CRP/FNR family cyclic AMP-dependent transcriptional regulator